MGATPTSTRKAGFSFLKNPITQSKQQKERPEDIHRVFVLRGGAIREVGDNHRKTIPQIPKLRRF